MIVLNEQKNEQFFKLWGSIYCSWKWIRSVASVFPFHVYLDRVVFKQSDGRTMIPISSDDYLLKSKDVFIAVSINTTVSLKLAKSPSLSFPF